MRNEGHYIRTKPRDEDIFMFTSFTNKTNWWKFILILGLLVLAGPFFPRYGIRSLPKTEADYWQKLIVLASIVTTVAVILVWTLFLKPYLNIRRGYNLRGQFEVIKKINFLGRKKLRLSPGTNHFIKVDRQFFKFINVGDKVHVERRPLGDVIKIKKV